MSLTAKLAHQPHLLLLLTAAAAGNMGTGSHPVPCLPATLMPCHQCRLSAAVCALYAAMAPCRALRGPAAGRAARQGLLWQGLPWPVPGQDDGCEGELVRLPVGWTPCAVTPLPGLATDEAGCLCHPAARRSACHAGLRVCRHDLHERCTCALGMYLGLYQARLTSTCRAAVAGPVWIWPLVQTPACVLACCACCAAADDLWQAAFQCQC